MEFDEINALINIEREKYQQDLALGNIINVSHSIKQDKAWIIVERAEQAALLRTKKCAREVELALIRLNNAMKVHAVCMKRAYDFWM